MLSRLGFTKKNKTNQNTTQKKGWFTSAPKNDHYIVENADYIKDKTQGLKYFKVRKYKGTSLNKGVRTNYKISAKGIKEKWFGNSPEEMKQVTLVESTTDWLKRHASATAKGLKSAAYMTTKEGVRFAKNDLLLSIPGITSRLAKRMYKGLQAKRSYGGSKRIRIDKPH